MGLATDNVQMAWTCIVTIQFRDVAGVFVPRKRKALLYLVMVLANGMGPMYFVDKLGAGNSECFTASV